MAIQEESDSGRLPVVILGSGLAGYGVAREFRKLDTETPLLMITADSGASYSKPLLSTGFTKNKTAAELVQAEAGAMAEQLNMALRVNTRVTAIEPDRRLVHIGHEQVPYRQLVLALGAQAIDLGLSGSGVDRVVQVNDLTDYEHFRQALPEDGQVVILGAGLIGCEFANDLRNGGYPVTVVAPSDQVMPGLLPPEAAAAVQEALEREGVRFCLGTVATAVESATAGVRVHLDTGEQLPADLVLSAVGLKPRTDLAADAGLATGQGIKVSQLLATGSPDIYALGDCAEVDGLVLMYVLPLMASARALARTLTGEPTRVRWGVMPVMVKTPCCPAVAVPPPVGAEGEWQVQQEGLNVRALFRDSAGQLSGFALTGEAVIEKQALARELPPALDP